MTITVEQLLATLRIDSTELLTTVDDYVIIHRDPQPSEAGISQSTDVSFLIVDLNGNPASPPPVDIQIFIEGILVAEFDGTTLTPVAPWSGSVVLPFGTDPYCGWKFFLEQPTPPIFSSEQQVEVSVRLVVGGGYGHAPWGHFPYGHAPVLPGPTVDFDYDFFIEDLTAPKVIFAEAIDEYTIRVTFDDDMTFESLSDPDDWQIARNNVDPDPAVSLDVISVAPVVGDETRVDLTVQWEQTGGCLYTVTVPSTSSDDNGNVIDSDFMTAQFAGFQYAQPLKRRFDHWSMMVPLINRQEDKTQDLLRFSNCIKEPLGLMLATIDRFADQYDPDLATDEQIEEILLDIGNPFGWIELSATDKRKLTRILYDIYELKGSAVGIEQAILFFTGEIVDVVPYTAEGWILGEDTLGSGSLAEAWSSAAEPYDMSSDCNLVVELDTGTIDILFSPVMFAIPAAATADEVVSEIDSQITGGGAYPFICGTAAQQVIAGSPFVLSGGETVELTVNGESVLVVFHASDFVTAGAATAPEVAARFAIDASDLDVSSTETAVTVKTKHLGVDAEIVFVGGTGLAALGIAPGTTVTGSDAKRVAIYSLTEGVYSSVEITGGTANAVLQFDDGREGGTGGAILGPDVQRTLYSFDIETQTELDDETKIMIRKIVDYMKVAHEHLVNIRVKRTAPVSDEWILGVSEMDESTILTE